MRTITIKIINERTLEWSVHDEKMQFDSRSSNLMILAHARHLAHFNRNLTLQIANVFNHTKSRRNVHWDLKRTHSLLWAFLVSLFRFIGNSFRCCCTFPRGSHFWTVNVNSIYKNVACVASPRDFGFVLEQCYGPLSRQHTKTKKHK